MAQMPVVDAAVAFRPYSATHAAVVLGFAAVTGLAVVAGRRRREAERARRFDRALGWVAFAVWVVTQAYGFLPGQYRPDRVWPIQVCDVAGLVAPLVLWTGWRRLRAVLYFWGLGLSTQAFVQPDVNPDMASVDFWTFWLAHGAVVGTAAYDLAARGFRPGWRDYGTAVLALAAWLAVVLPLDVVTGYNYGYVGGDAGGQPAFILGLGPWPGRLVWLSLLAAAAMAMLVVPWDLARRTERRRAGNEGPPAVPPAPPPPDAGGTLGSP